MYKHFKLLTMSVLTCSLVPNINSMDSNIGNSNIKCSKNEKYINVNESIKFNQQFNINDDDDNNCFEYDPYSTNSPIPEIQDMLKFMNIKELSTRNSNVKQCFEYLQEYDTKNCLLLDELLKKIYSIAKNISAVPNRNFIHDRSFSEAYGFNNFFCNYYNLRKRYLQRYRDYSTNLVPEEEQQDNKFEIGQFPELQKSFNILRCKLNPEKYNKNDNTDDLYYKIKGKTTINFFYYLSNVLVCLSHDLVYSINKEIRHLPGYGNNIKTVSNDSEATDKRREEASRNVSNKIKLSFHYIKSALVNIRNGMFLITSLFEDNFEDNTDREFYYKGFKYYIENNIRLSMNYFEERFNKLLEEIESNTGKNNAKKIQTFMKEFKEYKQSEKFMNKLEAEIAKDKNLDITNKYNNIMNFYFEYKKEYPHCNIDISLLQKDGKINTDLVNKINNANIDTAYDMLLQRLNHISTKVYDIYYDYYYYDKLYNKLYNAISSKIKYYIIKDHEHHCKYKYCKEYYDSRELNELIKNKDFCYDTYYKKYAKILWDDINEILDKIFKENNE